MRKQLQEMNSDSSLTVRKSIRGLIRIVHLAVPVCITVSAMIVPTLSMADVSLVSVNDSGVKGNGQSTRPDVSQDSRFVVFTSSAGTLRPGSNMQVVVKDMVSDSINLISKAPDGTPGDSSSTSPVTISADGRYVTFGSYASNLVGGDTSGTKDLFWHDQFTGETKMINIAPDGSRGDGSANFQAINGNGRYVAFRSSSTNLTADTVSGYQVYVRDMFANTTKLVSRNSSGSPQGGGEPDIDSAGRWVAYRGAPGSAVYAVDTWNCSSTSCNVIQANVNNSGNPVPGHTSVLFPKISGNGNFVTWESNAVGFVSGDTNGQADIFVRDLALAQTSRVSIASDGSQSDSFSYTPDISDDGRYVNFTSNATNLSASDSNGTLDVFVHDRLTGETVRVSERNDGGDATSGAGYYARMAGDGLAVAFSSISTNLVPEDTDSTEDVYLASLAPPNNAPVSEAGDNQATPVGEIVTLTGLASSDDTTPTGLLSFQWNRVSSPSGSTAVIEGEDTATPTVAPDMPGTYEISLVVTDEHGQPSTPDSMFIEAELLPAFVFERLHSGGGTYESLYDRDDGYWSGLSDHEYWRPAALQDGEVLGTKIDQQYFYDSLSATYSNDYSSSIGKLGQNGEDIFVSAGDEIPGSGGNTFRYLWSEGNDEDALYFRGYGSNYNYNNSLFKFDFATQTVSTNSAIVPPVPVAGESDELTSLWRDYRSRISGTPFYQGSNGTCPRYRTYTNYYGYTYNYCIYHRGLYLIDAGVATRVVDNTMTVPGEGANDYFYSFYSGVYDQQSGYVYFVGYWRDEASSKYRQGIFKGDGNGVLVKVLDDEDINWDRGWFNTLRVADGKLYAGGGRYQSGYELGQWWSSSQQGIYRVSDTEVESVVTGGDSSWYSNNWYDGYNYSYLSTSVNTWNFQVEGNALAYSRYLYSYSYDGTSHETQYDYGLFWKAEGFERRIAGSDDEILGITYDHVTATGNGDWLEGRSVVISGSNSTYTADYDPVEDQDTYSGTYIRDVLIARFDTDRDGIGDDLDNCVERPNTDQFDSDLNGIGDVCEDSDEDYVVDGLDNCPLIENTNQLNSDSDPFGDACDVCPFETDDQSDVDDDEVGDACDDNSDEDSLVDLLDNCPFITNEDQSNLDEDLLGDVCDPDIDGDGISNEVDGEWNGATFIDESLVESNNFSDHALGGNSFGRILNRGQLKVLISDAPDKENGILVNAVNGSGSGLIKQCDYRGREARLDLQQGTIAIIDCGSIAVRTIANSVQLILDSELVINVPAQVAARIIDLSDDSFVVANESEAPLPVEMKLGDEVSVTLPDGTVGEIEETAPGQFEIRNRPESVQPITTEANGITYVYLPGDIGVPVQVDIKPDSENNTINLGSNGVVPVAILSSPTFDATQVDPATVTLASAPVRLRGKSNLMSSVTDVNQDGLDDLLVHCDTTALELEEDSVAAVINGTTFSNVQIMGMDNIRVVPK